VSDGESRRFVLVGGNTATARIDGISAAGAAPEVMVHTPAADLEIVEYGRPVRAPVVPVSPTGCPTPAVVTRAVRELLGFETLAVDAGLARPTDAPTVATGASTGADVRDAQAVPDADAAFARGRELGRSLPDDALAVGETVPGGTTTALGVLVALGEQPNVSSSLPDNPLALKRRVVDEGLAASDLAAGGAAGDPVAALRAVGDPVLAVVAGLTVGAAETDTDVLLAGGTQLATAAALARHAGVERPVSLATTSFVAADDSADVAGLAADLDVELTVTDPGFERLPHSATDAYAAGEAKEGVGMGGALALADRAGVPMADVRDRLVAVYDRLVDEPPAP
jgi:uncharacterized protein (TIGR00303 family)